MKEQHGVRSQQTISKVDKFITALRNRGLDEATIATALESKLGMSAQEALDAITENRVTTVFNEEFKMINRYEKKNNVINITGKIVLIICTTIITYSFFNFSRNSRYCASSVGIGVIDKRDGSVWFDGVMKFKGPNSK